MNKLLIKIWAIIGWMLISIPAMSQGRIIVTSDDSETVSNKSTAFTPKKSNYLIVDTAQYKITYSSYFIPDTANINSKRDGYTVTLIGNKYAKFVDKYELESALLRDKLRSMGVSRAERSQKVFNVKILGIYSEHILLDYPRKGINTFQSYLSGSYRRYQDDSAIQKWDIKDETRDILGYTCRKAICRFRGRDYEAWYAEELPIPYGPYYFKGLPGLIIELYDTNKEYVFNMVGIERPDEIIDLSIYNGKAVENLSREDFRFLKEYYNDNAAATLTDGPVKVQMTPEEQKELEKRLNRPRPYNPIEKE